MKRNVAILLILAMAIAEPVVAQVPPPPPMPGQSVIVKSLKAAIEQNDWKLYSSLLSDNLKVYDDANIVADNKSKWMRIFGPKLQAKGVKFDVKEVYQATGRVTFIENFNSAASWSNDDRVECCWSTDITAYVIDNGKVSTIYHLKGGEETALK